MADLAKLPAALRARYDEMNQRAEGASPIVGDDVDNSSWLTRFPANATTEFSFREDDQGFRGYATFNDIRLVQAQAGWRNRNNMNPNAGKVLVLDMSFRVADEEIGAVVDGEQFPAPPYSNDEPVFVKWRDRVHTIKAQCFDSKPEVVEELQAFLLDHFAEQVDYFEEPNTRNTDGNAEPWLWRINFLMPTQTTADGAEEPLYKMRGGACKAIHVSIQPLNQRRDTRSNNLMTYDTLDKEPFTDFFRGVMHSTDCLLEVATETDQEQRDAMRAIQYSLTGRTSRVRDNTESFFAKDATVSVIEFEGATFKLRGGRNAEDGTPRKAMTAKEMENRKNLREQRMAERDTQSKVEAFTPQLPPPPPVPGGTGAIQFK